MTQKNNRPILNLTVRLPYFNHWLVMLFVVLGVLKAFGVIKWSWLWVSVPIWGWWVFRILFFICAFLAFKQNALILRGAELKLQSYGQLEKELEETKEQLEEAKEQIKRLEHRVKKKRKGH